jgi:hypothetical protein
MSPRQSESTAHTSRSFALHMFRIVTSADFSLGENEDFKEIFSQAILKGQFP